MGGDASLFLRPAVAVLLPQAATERGIVEAVFPEPAAPVAPLGFLPCDPAHLFAYRLVRFHPQQFAGGLLKRTGGTQKRAEVGGAAPFHPKPVRYLPELNKSLKHGFVKAGIVGYHPSPAQQLPRHSVRLPAVHEGRFRLIRRHQLHHRDHVDVGHGMVEVVVRPQLGDTHLLVIVGLEVEGIRALAHSRASFPSV